MAMKLRLLGDSIRLRLTRTEVRTAGAGQSVVERTPFADGAVLEFALMPDNVGGVRAVFDGRRLSVLAHPDLLSDWANSDRVALAEPAEDARPRILVEKDFACLTPRDGDDDTDTYPHPEQGERSC